MKSKTRLRIYLPNSSCACPGRKTCNEMQREHRAVISHSSFPSTGTGAIWAEAGLELCHLWAVTSEKLLRTTMASFPSGLLGTQNLRCTLRMSKRMRWHEKFYKFILNMEICSLKLLFVFKEQVSHNSCWKILS